MFWKYNNVNSQHIETLLNKEDVTLQELLDDEDILQECKAQNKKLIDFLIQPEILEELVAHVTKEPASDVDEQLRYKHANTACELLTCDVPVLNEKLASDRALLDKLYAFLEPDPPLNPLLASFFGRTLAVLITRKSEQNWFSYQFTCLQVLEYIKTREEFVPLLLKHLGTSAIMDLVFKLVTSVEGDDMRQNVLSWLDSHQFMQKLVALLSPKVDAERHDNVCQLLCDIVRVSRDPSYSMPQTLLPDPLLNTLESVETAADLINHMFDGEKTETCFVSGITVLLAMLEVKNTGSHDSQSVGSTCPYPSPDSGQGSSSIERPSPVGAANVLSAILPRLKDFHNLLLDPPKRAPIRTTVETLDIPLGNTRIHVAKLLRTLIATNDAEVHRCIEELGMLDVLLDLFRKYSWNNFLHTQLEGCITLILQQEGPTPLPQSSDDGNQPMTEDENENETAPVESSSSNSLVTHLFQHCGLIQRIVDMWEENETQQAQPNGHRRGYMGHLVKIANDVVTFLELPSQASLAKSFLEKLSEETKTTWENLIVGGLADINKKNTLTLGGALPQEHNTYDDGEGRMREVPFSQDFTSQQAQSMSVPFGDTYGFTGDEFNDGDSVSTSMFRASSGISFEFETDNSGKKADLFEQICLQRAQLIGDGDDEIWTSGNKSAEFRRTSKDEAVEPSSSDEEDEEGEDVDTVKRVDSKMDVDSWPAFDNLNSAAAVAMDTGNPWNSSGAEDAPVTTEQGDWADFGSAFVSEDKPSSDGGEEKAPFYANFGSAFSDDASDGFGEECKEVPMDVTETKPTSPKASIPDGLPVTKAESEHSVTQALTSTAVKSESSINSESEILPLQVDHTKPEPLQSTPALPEKEPSVDNAAGDTSHPTENGPLSSSEVKSGPEAKDSDPHDQIPSAVIQNGPVQ